ncbi:MAG: DUF697 domain-containing protein [Scytonema sp. PMC 1069.18]|nr:DUF697 domain-containing protein [Scytonema sp. PMC 1069.18]MEC4884918.1 DUF697 domain-containing protein [Scytonema sp. PMC 1070.18]
MLNPFAKPEQFSVTELQTTDQKNMNNPEDLNYYEIINNSYKQALRERDHVNILIAGRTGVGKSTLINAVFEGEFATTGQGRPITQNTREIKKEGIPLSIFDTRGLEMADFSETLEALRKCIQERRGVDPSRHIHVAWICISEESRRVEKAEEQLVRMLNEHNIPVIAVITKAMSDGGFKDEVINILPDVKNAIRVNSIMTELDDGIVIKPKGLKELVDLTMQVVPEGQKSAFVASQKVDIELKKSRCNKIVASAAASAAAVGAAPIPLADAALIVPIQVSMIASISATFGLSLDKNFLSTMVASTITGGVGSLVGREIVLNLLWLFPLGFGVTGFIEAGVAAAITTTLGKTYIATLEALFIHNDGNPPTNEEVKEAFQKRREIEICDD